LPHHLSIEEPDGKEKESISGGNVTMKEMERELILRTLEDLEGNRTHAAKALGISIRTLRNKLSEYRNQKGMHD
jgi:DNA-binding NtrC family response regulator